MVSAKTGIGVKDVLDAIVERIPPPSGLADAPLKALVFDSKYDHYRGVVTYVRVVQGTIEKGQTVVLMRGGTKLDIIDIASSHRI